MKKYLHMNFTLKPEANIQSMVDEIKNTVHEDNIKMLLIGACNEKISILSKLEILLPETPNNANTKDILNLGRDATNIVFKVMKIVHEYSDTDKTTTSTNFVTHPVSDRVKNSIANMDKDVYMFMFTYARFLDAGFIDIYDNYLNKDKWLEWARYMQDEAEASNEKKI